MANMVSIERLAGELSTSLTDDLQTATTCSATRTRARFNR